MRSKALIRRSCQAAAHIFTVSNYCKEKISEIYGIPPERISVTPNAVDHLVFHPQARDKSREIVKKAFGLTDFILSVGRLERFYRGTYWPVSHSYRLALDEIPNYQTILARGVGGRYSLDDSSMMPKKSVL